MRCALHVGTCSPSLCTIPLDISKGQLSQDTPRCTQTTTSGFNRHIVGMCVVMFIPIIRAAFCLKVVTHGNRYRNRLHYFLPPQSRCANLIFPLSELSIPRARLWLLFKMSNNGGTQSLSVSDNPFNQCVFKSDEQSIPPTNQIKTPLKTLNKI